MKIKQVEKEFYDGAVAYIGEVIKNRINGKWIFKHKNSNNFHPLISTLNEEVYYDPITPIWETMIYGQEFELRKKTISEIRRNQLDKNIFG